MLKTRWTIFFFVSPFLLVSQMKTPFVKYDYESDVRYIKELESLKKNKNQSSKIIIKSIAELSYYYKDWDNAIDYYEKLVVDSTETENYFKLGVAAARKSLEVSRFFSVPYVLKARESILRAYELEPKNPVFLNLLIQLYAEIPSVLGGNINFAEEKANELMVIDSLEGLMTQAYLFQIKNNFEASKSKYAEVFLYLKKEFGDQEDAVRQLKRNFIFELGRACTEYKMELDLGLTSFDLYIETFDFTDNYPLEWAYYYRSKIYFYNDLIEKGESSLQKALEIKPDFKVGLDF